MRVREASGTALEAVEVEEEMVDLVTSMPSLLRYPRLRLHLRQHQRQRQRQVSGTLVISEVAEVVEEGVSLRLVTTSVTLEAEEVDQACHHRHQRRHRHQHPHLPGHLRP